MTCNNCIHGEMCARRNKMVQIDEHTWDEFEPTDNVEDLCKHFINKADFVEVVRCEKCTRSVDYEGRIMCNKFGHKFQGEWYGLRATTKDHFCGHGVRK